MRFVVNSLGARAQSVAEIERKLAARNVQPEVVADVITAARGLGYLDDATLAAQLAHGLRDRGYGRRRAALSLRTRGLSPDDANVAIEEAFGGADETALAVAALRTRRVTAPQDVRRAVAYLVRRGFSSGAAWSAVRAREAGER
jgi:regulatory protein